MSPRRDPVVAAIVVPAVVDDASAVADLDGMTQQNAALVEQSAAAAESLREQAERLGQVVSTFRLSSAAAA